VTIFTIGHSNRPFEPYLEALQAHGITLVVDVRRFPSSRRHPHFSRSRLEPALAQHGIAYRHMADLGGHREPAPDSPNTAWREPAFRGYADYMQTQTFAAAISALLEEGGKRPTAIMCAELRWMECHRGLISDYLKAGGHDVVHVISATEHEPHPYTRQSRIVDGQLSYRGLL
jgi:uncharacterized protein (DUF488 family)